MSSDDIAVQISNLSKCYHVYANPRDRIKQLFIPNMQKIVGTKPKQYFDEFWALRNVSFSIKVGETIGIIGQNGSGKSTLLQMICGTLHPTDGEVRVTGRIAALLELGSGFNPEFTGRENIYLNAAVLGLSKREVDDRFDEIATFADIGHFIEQPIKNYSSGMKVRLAFAVIAHVDADILVIDEALSVGDAFFTQKCMRYLRNFMKKGTVLFVSHDTGAVANLCSKAVFLENGKVINIGPPKEVIEHYLTTLFESNKVSHPKQHSITNLDDNFNTTSKTNNSISGSAEFNTGSANVSSVNLLDHEGRSLSHVNGGEDVILEIQSQAHKDILHPVVGFQFKDRLGQIIFADNTFLAYQFNPVSVTQNSKFVTRFEFNLPILPSGDYSITIAIADGSQNSHTLKQWIHEALLVKVHSNQECQGLIGIPMKSIKISIS